MAPTKTTPQLAIAIRSEGLHVVEISHAAERVVEPVGVARTQFGVEPLPARFDLIDHLRVEQLAQCLSAQQFAQHVAVEGERLRPPFGSRHIELVEIGRRVGEHE